MASGTITLTRTGTGYLDGKILWSSVSNGSAANTSTVTAHLQIHRNSKTSNTMGTFTGSFTVDGTTENISQWYDLGYDYVTIKTITVTVAHDASGAGKCYLYGYVHGPSGGSMANTYVEGSQTVTLDTIPREAKITGAPDFTDLQNPTITYSNPLGNAAAALEACISFTGEKPDIAYRAIPKTGSSYTFPLTEAERNVLRANTPGPNRNVLFYIRTKIGTKEYHHYATKTLTIADDDVNRPEASMDLSVVSSLPSAFDGLYIQGKTGVKMDVSGTPKTGASISSYKYRVAGNWCDQIYNLTQTGTVKVEGFAVDSRDHEGSATQDINVIPYIKPKLDVSVCERCDADGVLTENGTYLKIRATRSYSKVEADGEQKNFCQIRYRYKRAAASEYSDWTTILSADDLSSNQVETGALLEGQLYEGDSYVVQVQAIDDIGDDSTSTITISTEHVYMHRTKNAMGLGKYAAAENALDLAWNLLMNGNRIHDVPYPESDTEPVTLGYLKNCDLTPMELGKIEELDAFHDKGKFRIGHAILNDGVGYSAYLCFQILWISLQFKVSYDGVVYRRMKYGNNPWSGWTAI